jgi:zinc protease
VCCRYPFLQIFQSGALNRYDPESGIGRKLGADGKLKVKIAFSRYRSMLITRSLLLKIVATAGAIGVFTSAAGGTVIAGNAGIPVPSPIKDYVTTGGVTSYVLNNGFKVILIPYPSAGQAKVSLVVRTGSKLEGYGESGMAHLLEHMIYLGAGNRRSVKADLTKLNASWNGTTSVDRTNYFATIPADQRKLEELIRIKADMFLAPRFTAEDLKREMTVVRNEMEMGENNPGSKAYAALMRQAFAWHGYGRSTIGARSDVERAPFSALTAFHRKHYRPDNAFLIVGGNFEPKATVALVNRLFGRAKNPSSPAPASWTREEIQPVNSRSEVFLPSGRTVALSAWKLPPAVNRETTAFQVATVSLCSYDWGVLRKQLVTELKIATNAGCETRAMQDATVFSLSASAGRDGDPVKMLDAAVGIVEASVAKGISAEDLERARQEVVNATERVTLSMPAFTAALEANEIAGDWRYFFTTRDQLGGITLDEANAALRKWITPLGRSDVVLRHRDKAELPTLPDTDAIGPLLAGRQWAPVASEISSKPTSWSEFKSAVQFIDLGDAAKGALIQRRSSGDRVWLEFRNRFGNPDYLRDRVISCTFASMLVSYGGAGLDRNALDARLEALDATWSMTNDVLSLSVKRQNLDAALDLLLRVRKDPLLPEDEFQRMKSRAISGIDDQLTNPAAVAARELDLRFDNYPAGHLNKPRSFAEFRERMEALDYAQVKQCSEDARGLSDALLVMVGDVPRTEFLRLWREHFKSLPKSPVPFVQVRDPRPPEALDTSEILVSLPNKPAATLIAAGLIPLKQGDADLAALRLGFLALGGNANSRLFQRLREAQGLSYNAGASLSPHPRDPRTSWRISASAGSADYGKAQVVLRKTVDETLRDGFTDEEISSVRKTWLDGRKMTFTNEEGYAGFVAGLMANDTSFDFLIDYDRRIGALGAAEVNAAFRKHVRPDGIVWAVGVGSEAGAAAVRKE